MSDCCLLQNMDFDFEKENEYLRITVILVVSTGFGDNQFYGWMGVGGTGRCLYVHS